jgi:hypothetical protein
MITELKVRMLASICMLKLRGFAQDLGGKIVDGPGPQDSVVHVRLRVGGKSAPAWNIPGSESYSGLNTASSSGAKATPFGFDVEMEMRVQRPDPKQPDNLTISLNLRAANNAWAVSRTLIQEHFDKILRDLKGYLQSAITSPGDYIPTNY